MRWPFGRSETKSSGHFVSEAGDHGDVLGSIVPNAAGEYVNAATAISLPVFFGGLRLITETLGSLPFHLHQRGDDGARQRDREHPAASVLARPNGWTSRFEFIRRLTADAILTGAGFAIVSRVRGEPRELRRVPSSAITVQVSEHGEPSYRLQLARGGVRVLHWRDVVHVAPFINVDERGTSLLHVGGEAIGYGLALQRHASNFFRNGARPSAILTAPKNEKGVAVRYGAKYLQMIKAVWQEAHGGANSGGVAVLDGGSEFKTISADHVSSQFVEQRRENILDICRILGIPPTLLGALEKATLNNVEELGLQFQAYCLRAWADIWEAAFSRVLLTDEEQDRFFIEAEFGDLVKANIAKRAEAFAKVVGAGIVAPNEARAAGFNLPGLPGGDDLRLPLNTEPGSQSDSGSPRTERSDDEGAE